MVSFSLSFCRYSSFALFTLCNAVLCVIAVWNMTIAQEIGWTPPIDLYFIAIGAAGILWMFPVMFLDQLRRNALINRVWFESVWVGFFSAMNLAGAAAVTAMLPHTMCNLAVHLPGACATTDVLLAFSWLGTVNLLAYICIVLASAILHMKDDPTIWSAHTRTYPWFGLREQLDSARPSPVRTTWSKPSLPSAAPSIHFPSDRTVASGTLKSSAVQSSTMKSSTLNNEKPSAINSALRKLETPLTVNKSAKILQSAWISATVTPASPPSDEYSAYSSGSDRSDLTSTPTGLPPSAMYIPFSSTIKPSPIPPRSSSLAMFGQPPLSALLTPAQKGSLRSAAPMPSPKPPMSAKPHASGPRNSKRKSNRPPPLDMTRLHSTYGR